MESLENRELLSVNPTGCDLFAETEHGSCCMISATDELPPEIFGTTDDTLILGGDSNIDWNFHTNWNPSVNRTAYISTQRGSFSSPPPAVDSALDDELVYLNFGPRLSGIAGSSSPAIKVGIYIDGDLHLTDIVSEMTIPIGYSGIYTIKNGVSLGALTAGNHEIKIVLDPDNEVAETDETNNEFIFTFTVTESPLGPVGQPVATATLETNGVVRVSWTEIIDATHYQVKRLDADGVSWTILSDVSPDTGYTAKDLYFIDVNPPDGLATYQVRAFRNAASSMPYETTVMVLEGHSRLPRLSSLEDATHTIYLDFDGHVTHNSMWNSAWGYGNIYSPAFDIDGDPTSFSDVEVGLITDIWAVVAEYYSPFNVNVTTVFPGFENLYRDSASDNAYGVRAVVSGTTDWYSSGVYGVAPVAVFDRVSRQDNEAFIFAQSTYERSTIFQNDHMKYATSVAGTVSHEVGHMLSLGHDGGSGGEYYRGHYVTGTSNGMKWAPIMGSITESNSYYYMRQWSKGDYYIATNKEDDLQIVADNGFGFRTDTDGILFLNTQTTGVIETSGDSDAYSLVVTSAGVYEFEIAAGVNVGGRQISSLYFAYDFVNTETSASIASGTASINTLSASFSETLDPGSYSLIITGVGMGDPYAATSTNGIGGFDEYGSVGTYTIDLKTSVPTPPVAPVNFRSTSQTSTSVTLEWAAQAGLTGYTLQYRVAGTSIWNTWLPAPEVTATFATITGLVPDTEYEFMLTATNLDGTAYSETTARTKTASVDPPVAPVNFRSTDQTSSSVTLEWNAQAGLTGYTLQYRVVDAPTWETWTPAPDAAATVATITGLLPDTNYEFRLTAMNDAGSAYSETTAKTKTPAVDPPVSPVFFRSTDQTSSSVTLEWNAQTGLTGYTLEYRVANASTWGTWSPAPGVTATSATITGLLPETDYEFRLTAANEAGSAYSETTARTKAIVHPPVAPTNFRSTDQTVGSVTLQWNVQTGLTGYVLEYRKYDETGWTTWDSDLDPDATGAIITGLSSSTHYVFQLTAINSAGTAEATTEATTKAGMPVDPTSFRSTGQTHNSVTLVWDSQPGLDGYFLQYKKYGETNWTVWKPVLGPTATGATVTGLDPSTLYVFQLTATNATGSKYATTEATTKAAPPTAPAKFQSTGQTLDSVMLEWETQAGLTGYTLEYKKTTDSSWTTWSPAPGAAETSATVTDLDPDTQYDFRLTAKNLYGEASSTTKATTKLTLPVAPTHFTSTEQTYNSVTLAWDAQFGLDGYTLEYKTATAADWTTWDPAPDPEATGATITGLLATTKYEFRLTASNAAGSNYSLTETTTKVLPPVAPSVFVCTRQTFDSVTLAWTSQSDLTGYTLEYKTATATGWTEWTPAPAPTATDATITGLLANTKYEFRLTAVNVSGSASSTTEATTMVAAPMVPTNFESTAQTSDSVTLAWDLQSDLDGYTLAYRITGETNWTNWTPAPGPTATGATITGLPGDTEYEFQLTATNATGSASVLTKATTKVTQPAAPTSFTSTSQTYDSVTLAWDLQSGLDGYVLEYKTVADQGWTVWTPAPDPAATGATITGLLSETKYQFRLTAENTSGSAYSTAEATTKVTPPTAPRSFAVSAHTYNSVSLVWASQSDLDGYLLEYKTATGLEWTEWTPAPDPTATAATVTGLQADTQYEFRLTAVNESGSASSLVEATTDVHDGKPAKPVVTATYDAAIGVTLTWPPVSGAETYKVYRLDGEQWTTISPKNFTGTAFVDPEAPASGTYGVRTYIGSAYSDLVVVTAVPAPTDKPAPPTGFTATVAGDEVELAWNPVSGADTYQVWRWSGTEWVTVARNITGTSCVDENPELGTGSYIVKARNAAGFGDEATASTVAVPPAPPTGFKATVDGTVVNLSWNPSNGADTYQVWRWDAVKSDWVTVAKNITGTSCVDQYPEFGTGTYIIKARNAAGNSDVATTSTSDLKPNAPTNFVATEVEGVVNLSWNLSAGAETYQVWRWDAVKSDWVTVARNITGTSCVDENPELGTGLYAVKAHNINGYSQIMTATIASDIVRPVAPIVSARYLGGSNVELTWATVPEADSYKVWRRLDGQSWTDVPNISGGNIADNFFTDTEAPEGVTVYYAVRAYVQTLFGEFEEVSVETVFAP